MDYKRGWSLKPECLIVVLTHVISSNLSCSCRVRLKWLLGHQGRDRWNPLPAASHSEQKLVLWKRNEKTWRSLTKSCNISHADSRTKGVIGPSTGRRLSWRAIFCRFSDQTLSTTRCCCFDGQNKKIQKNWQQRRHSKSHKAITSMQNVKFKECTLWYTAQSGWECSTALPDKAVLQVSVEWHIPLNEKLRSKNSALTPKMVSIAARILGLDWKLFQLRTFQITWLKWKILCWKRGLNMWQHVGSAVQLRWQLVGPAVYQPGVDVIVLQKTAGLSTATCHFSRAWEFTRLRVHVKTTLLYWLCGQIGLSKHIFHWPNSWPSLSEAGTWWCHTCHRPLVGSGKSTYFEWLRLQMHTLQICSKWFCVSSSNLYSFHARACNDEQSGDHSNIMP